MKHLRHLLLVLISLFLLTSHGGVFAASGETTDGSGGIISENTDTGAVVVETKTETAKERTMNDINTFLIESYKLKIDKVLMDLNTSIEKATRNDPDAQITLLEKIRNDIGTKVHLLGSPQVSINRKKILTAVFKYIQQNLDTSISKLSKQKLEK